MLVKITVKELAQYFECPVCYQYLQSVSFVQCQNGHSGCITCYSKLSTCPMCRLQLKITRPAWAGFKTAEEGRAKICKFLWQKLKNKSNIKNI